MEENVDELQKGIEQLQKCKANLLESAPISETFQDKTVWQGIVYVFSLIGHPTATKCYAWSSPIEGSKKRRIYTVLNVPPVDSPEKAVRAAIVSDYKSGQLK